jgi:hypothetical protein
MYAPAYTALAAQLDAKNVTQLALRSGIKEVRPRKVNTYLIRLSFETQLEHIQPITIF